MPSARNAGGSAPHTAPRPPVLVSGAHSGATQSTRIKKDPGRGTGVGCLHTPEGGGVRMQGGNRAGYPLACELAAYAAPVCGSRGGSKPAAGEAKATTLPWL